ncbi:MAG: 3-(3-hydroxyphenyl)propionate hydroxylase, partial [Mycolicibacterium neoaurum]|nr:3-(3-hydroxyphenyl)propionate hydroxylase [Mycolicibacterium neoaurum]
TLKRYILEMRFKPMPRYDAGAVVHTASTSAIPPAGTLFIQPTVDTRDSQNVLLDEVLGTGFAVLAWNNNPRALLSDSTFARWKSLGANLIEARPNTQLYWTGHDDPDVTVVGDRTGALKRFFDAHAESVLFLRPDRCIAAACLAQLSDETSTALFDVLCLTEGGESHVSDRPVLHVAQPPA